MFKILSKKKKKKTFKKKKKIQKNTFRRHNQEFKLVSFN